MAATGRSDKAHAVNPFDTCFHSLTIPDIISLRMLHLRYRCVVETCVLLALCIAICQYHDTAVSRTTPPSFATAYSSILLLWRNTESAISRRSRFFLFRLLAPAQYPSTALLPNPFHCRL